VVDEGGDAPCWAESVCEACGALVDTGGHACPRVRPIRRSIVGFHQDPLGDWVAELSCLHSQHQRHRPPFQMRPWVLSTEGREAHLGTGIDCPPCARAELPNDLIVARTAGPFDAAGMPAGLLANHVVAEGRWGCLHVVEGTVTFSMQTDPPTVVRLRAGDRQPIPPGIPHALTIDGPVRLSVDFLKAVDTASSSAPDAQSG
jgi:tellurite methyltransferase